MALLTDELRGWVGREVTYPAHEPLSRASIRYFALALDDRNPLYTDPDAARAAGYRDVIAPPTLICETCQYSNNRPHGNGYIGHEWDLPVTNMRMIRAGNDYSFERPVHPDDEVTVTWRLENIEEKPSRRGGTQLYVTSLGRYENQDGALLATNRERVVLQPIDPEAAS